MGKMYTSMCQDVTAHALRVELVMLNWQSQQLTHEFKYASGIVFAKFSGPDKDCRSLVGKTCSCGHPVLAIIQAWCEE